MSHNPGIAKFLSVDPLMSKMPGWSPYNYTFGNPVTLIDDDGRIPILPLLIKAGANAAADWFMQTTVNYYFNPNTQGDWNASAYEVNGWQIARSGLEGLIPWRTPGGKLGRAAFTATSDVIVNYAYKKEQYSIQEATTDFAVGFLSDLAGGEIGALINKYGGKAIARGYRTLNLPVPEQALKSIEIGLLENTLSVGKAINFTERQLKRKFKHASDFGVGGNPNRANFERFEQAIKEHINDPNTAVISGTYRKNNRGTHFYNVKTKNWIFVDNDGQFHTGWELSSKQRENLLIKGDLN